MLLLSACRTASCHVLYKKSKGFREVFGDCASPTWAEVSEQFAKEKNPLLAEKSKQAITQEKKKNNIKGRERRKDKGRRKED